MIAIARGQVPEKLIKKRREKANSGTEPPSPENKDDGDKGADTRKRDDFAKRENGDSPNIRDDDDNGNGSDIGKDDNEAKKKLREKHDMQN